VHHCFSIASVVGRDPLFSANFRPIVVNLVSSSKEEKADLVRSMAERCLAGEFDGSAFKS
jgi:hypothetical protein